MFDVIRIPAFKDNYIWLLRKGASALVVDPGDACPVLEVLEREGLTLESILVTHHHADHQGGVADLLSHFPAKVFGPATESITALTQPLHGGETIRLDLWASTFRLSPFPDIRLDTLPTMVPGLCSVATRCLAPAVGACSRDRRPRCTIP